MKAVTLARLALFVSLINVMLAMVVFTFTLSVINPLALVIMFIGFILVTLLLFSEAARGIMVQVAECRFVKPKNPLALLYCETHQSYQYNPSYMFCIERLKAEG